MGSRDMNFGVPGPSSEMAGFQLRPPSYTLWRRINCCAGLSMAMATVSTARQHSARPPQKPTALPAWTVSMTSAQEC